MFIYLRTMSTLVTTQKVKKEKIRPYPLNLGDLKPHLQSQAFADDRSLHYWIMKILRDHLRVTDPSYKEKKKP